MKTTFIPNPKKVSSRFMFLLGIMFVSGLGQIVGQVKTHKAIVDSEIDILTVVNVITPNKGQQQDIVENLQKGLTDTMRYQDGFISASIHKSLDSDHIIVYAQWRDQESLQNAVKLIESGGAPNMLYVFSNSTPEYHPYDVVSVNLAANRK
ncbi:antibiotic biosynthesis monooxygenase family protein [Flagellimonas allohymeniacidonis]|uniref:Antibiotic biosynthesis monooxygenase n=1 Tax=Flagellimonas allohymeniacidonis TaxID=2517819 RepID=A0A4Q8QC88_9FLAO|nr:antibiotic biosynthesis monooxygenase family protein [Allomuricauda hymeniacidonis]TAI47274.1 antibiotic biosynthesis monooxygenase [Allomuricauda hymeniacidonis]